MSETRPSMVKSCRVWLRDRQDIPEEKRICINALFDRAEPAEVIVHRGVRIVCPVCGSGMKASAKFCHECGQRVNVKVERIFTEEVIEQAKRRIAMGERITDIAEDMGVNRSSLVTALYIKKVEKQGKRRQYRQYTMDELRAAKERHDNGESWNAIAKSLERDGGYLKKAAEKIIGENVKEK